jgi:hypothetical protein
MREEGGHHKGFIFTVSHSSEDAIQPIQLELRRSKLLAGNNDRNLPPHDTKRRQKPLAAFLCARPSLEPRRGSAKCTSVHGEFIVGQDAQPYGRWYDTRSAPSATAVV